VEVEERRTPLLVESFVAEVTSEGTLTRVRPHVDDTICPGHKILAAMLTRPGAGMFAHGHMRNYRLVDRYHGVCREGGIQGVLEGCDGHMWGGAEMRQRSSSGSGGSSVGG